MTDLVRTSAKLKNFPKIFVSRATDLLIAQCLPVLRYPLFVIFIAVW